MEGDGAKTIAPSGNTLTLVGPLLAVGGTLATLVGEPLTLVGAVVAPPWFDVAVVVGEFDEEVVVGEVHVGVPGSGLEVVGTCVLPPVAPVEVPMEVETGPPADGLESTVGVPVD